MMTFVLLLTGLIAIGIECGTDHSKGSLPCKLYNATHLDCSHRELTTTYLLRYPEAKYLDLSHNQLQTLNGEHFVKLVGLQVLDASYNKLSKISSAVFSHFASLWRLNLSNNPSLFGFGLELGNISTLRDLNLRLTNLYALGSNKFQGLHKLVTLDLSFQTVSYQHSVLEFTLLGKPFEHLQLLKKLNLSVCGIKTLTPSVFEGLQNLEVLDLSDNEIMHLPRNLFHNVTNLQFLDLHFNQLTKFNEKLFSGLPQLKYLDMDSVTYLDIDSTTFWFNDDLFSDLTTLQHFTVSTFINQIFSMPRFNLTLFIKTMPINSPILSFRLKVVDHPLEFDEQTFLPLSTWNSSLQSFQAQCFDCFTKCLGKRPLSLGDFTFSVFSSLRDLVVSDCKPLRISGSAFSNLEHLKLLSLPRNDISQVSYEILEDLSSIQHFDLSGNKLVEIQSNRWSLKTLTLSDNPISNASLRFSSIEKVYMENLNGHYTGPFQRITLPEDLTKFQFSAANNDYKPVYVGHDLCNQSLDLKHVYFKNVQFYLLHLTSAIQHLQFLLGNQCPSLKTLFMADFQFQPIISRQEKIFLPRLEQLTVTV